ncbi:MAG: hypothetical protein GY925_11615 [Actinomycetia bacterium]|nr:hypothetical protein [Actinomycetes bacterium]
MGDISRVELGTSIIEAEMIAQAAAAAGIRVELLRNGHPETGGLVALGHSALLVHSERESELRLLLAEFGY